MKNKEMVKNTITIANNVAFPSLRKGKSFKVLLFVASQVDKTLAPGSVHEVPMSLLTGILKFNLSNQNTAKIFEELEKITLNWASYNSNWNGFSHVISSCRYDSSRDVLSYSFDPMFIKEYLDKKTPFKNIPLAIIMGFRSNYALKIYELAVQYYNPDLKQGRTPMFNYEQLRELFSLKEGQYKNSGHFFDKVIKKPIVEAQEIGEYLIEFKHNKRRGILRRYWFQITLDPQARFDFVKIDKQLDRNDLNEQELKQEKEERKIRAKLFLEFWEPEFKKLCKRSMTEAERKIWVDPLLDEEPSLNLFAEMWLIDQFFSADPEKKEAYLNFCQQSTTTTIKN